MIIDKIVLNRVRWLNLHLKARELRKRVGLCNRDYVSLTRASNNDSIKPGTTAPTSISFSHASHV